MTKPRKKFDAVFKAKVGVGGAAGKFDGSGVGEAPRRSSETDYTWKKQVLDDVARLR